MTAPQRIVSLISSATEMLYLLGLGDRVVGISHECDYPVEIAGKPRLTQTCIDADLASRDIDTQVRTLTSEQASLYKIDVDRLVALAPDLIITQAQCDVCAVRYADVVEAVARSRTLAATQILALNPHRLDDVLQDIRQVGQATGTAARAEEVISALAARVTAVRGATDTLPDTARPRVACLEWIDPPMLAANWTPELVRWAGGRDGLQAGVHSSYANWDDIACFDPEVIVVMPCGFALERAIQESQVLATLPIWPELAAVRTGRVYAVDGNAYFNRSGPRLVDSLEILAHLIRPEHFDPPLNISKAWTRLVNQHGRLVGEIS